MQIIIGIAIAILVALLAWVIVEERKEWEAFHIEHKCVIVSKEQDSVGMGLSSDGKPTTIIISGKTGHRCNDGIIYYR